jgi:pimeloyl-ACP methyl ester carboxylesterase
MQFAMDCASGATARRRRQIERQAPKKLLGRLTDYPYPDLCETWPVTDLGDGFRAPLASSVRTLFVSGTLDGRTPVSNAREIARGFDDSEHLIIEGAGHEGTLRPPDAALEIVREFMADAPLSSNRVSVLPLSFEPVQVGG